MSSIDIGIAILAAGKGTRMKSAQPKVMAHLLGRRLIDFPLISSIEFLESNSLKVNIGAVVGHGGEQVENYLKQNYSDITCAYQKEQKGTADALKAYFNGASWSKSTKYTVVLCGDTPLIEVETLNKLFQEIQKNSLKAVVATFNTNNPYGYGRICPLRDKQFEIIEQKHLTAEQIQIDQVNAGLYFFETNFICQKLEEVLENKSTGEFYLTDVFNSNTEVAAVNFACEENFLGVNDQVQLEQARMLLNQRNILRLQQAGVRFLQPQTITVEDGIEVGCDSVIGPGVALHGNSIIGDSVNIEAGCILHNSKIEHGVHLKAYSYLENCHIKSESVVGPFARIRPDTVIGENSKIGNFVELKKAQLKAGVKISHLSYVGDAEIGEGSNIGCGFVTCNYDGFSKHKTKIGKNSFIGSDCQTVAPINIGNDTYVGSGSTLTSDVPDGALALSRSKQVNKEGYAARLKKRLEAAKKSKS